jgi:hypothetical protein
MGEGDRTGEVRAPDPENPASCTRESIVNGNPFYNVVPLDGAVRRDELLLAADFVKSD